MGVLGALIADTRRGRPAARENYTQSGLAQAVGSGRAARHETGKGWKAAAKQTAVGMAHGAAKVWVGTDTFGASAAPPQAHAAISESTNIKHLLGSCDAPNGQHSPAAKALPRPLKSPAFQRLWRSGAMRC